MTSRMRRLSRGLLSGLVALQLCASPAFAQQPDDSAKAKAVRSAERKIWIGIALAAAGASAIPLTRTDAAKEGVAITSAGLMFTGGTLVWLGARQRRQATSSQTTFGVAAGRKTAMYARRTW